ncbi:MAG: hypothetical protein [Olavius algarvensis Gamma 3 endosymbiont]|nr:MAG: hypothetical protein [Olavius algarvensis Gamma 3 endosymbiont]
MKNDYSKRSMPLNWGVSKSLTTSIGYNEIRKQKSCGLCRTIACITWMSPTLLVQML